MKNNIMKTNKEKPDDLSKVEGSVSYAIINNQDAVHEIMSKLPLQEAQFELIKLIKTNSNESDKQKNIMSSILKCKSKYDILMYLYNSILKGAGLGVIAV